MTARIARLRELLDRRERLAARLREAPGQLRAADAGRLEEWGRALEREAILSKELAEAEAPPSRPPAWRYAAAAALVAAGVICASLSRMLIVPGSIAALIGALWLIALFGRRKPSQEASALKARREALEALIEGRLSWAGGRSIDDARRLLAEAGSLASGIAEVEARLEEAAGGAGVDCLDLLARLDRECTDASLSLRALAKDRADLEEFRLDASDIVRLERDLAGRIEREAALGREAAGLERRLQATPAGDPAEIRERLEEARGELARVRRRVDTIEAVIEGLDEARSRMAGLLARRLPPLAGELLARLTGERWRELSIDPVTLAVRVKPASAAAAPQPDGALPESVDPAALSQGTRDQMHLAIRLALAEILSGVEPLPLLLDDPLVHSDPGRRARGLEILARFAERHQVVLFTCDPFYETIGARVVRLAG